MQRKSPGFGLSTAVVKNGIALLSLHQPKRIEAACRNNIMLLALTVPTAATMRRRRHALIRQATRKLFPPLSLYDNIPFSGIAFLLVGVCTYAYLLLQFVSMPILKYMNVNTAVHYSMGPPTTNAFFILSKA